MKLSEQVLYVGVRMILAGILLALFLTYCGLSATGRYGTGPLNLIIIGSLTSATMLLVAPFSLGVAFFCLIPGVVFLIFGLFLLACDWTGAALLWVWERF